MRDGYYLSVYMEIGKLPNLYEHGERHDHNISLWKKTGECIELIHYWELERLTGLKYHRVACFDVEQAKDLINQLLEPYHLSMDDMVEVWGTPELHNCDDYHSIEDYPEYSYHGIAHLFSAVLMDTELFNNGTIIGLGVDGGPDSVLDLDAVGKFFYAGCIVKQGRLEVFPAYSPGVIWELASHRFNLREGTLMALASASSSTAYLATPERILYNGNRDGRFLELKKYVDGLIEEVERLTPDDEGTKFNGFDPLFTLEENKISMVMKEIQKMSYKIMEKNVESILEASDINPQETYLALGGGYILNCPSNSHLMNKYQFKGFIAPPCVSDTGMSLGIALYAFYKKAGRFNFQFKNAFYGDKDDRLEAILNSGIYAPFIQSATDFDVQTAVDDIKESPIVWFNGAAEIGPRALGNRSLLADPRSETVKDELNRIKERQWWRPVAPMVLEENMGEWFEGAYTSPYMLHTFKIRNEKSALIPAVSHLDESARVQTVNIQDNPEMYKLIQAFDQDTGVPIICNTSLNDRGEPIINRIEEAMNFALRKGIKVAYINGKRLELRQHENYAMNQPYPRPLTILKSEEERERLKKELNPHQVGDDVLFYYFNTHKIHEMFDLTNKRSARELTIMARSSFKKLELDYIPWG